MTTQCYSVDDLYFKRISDSLLNFRLDTGVNSDQLKAVNLISSNKVQPGGVELQISDDLKQSDWSKLADSIYWSVSPLFIGNKVASYGGSIKYKIRISIPLNSQGVIRPDLMLVGQNITLIHTSLRQPADQEIFELTVDLLETQFSHLTSGSSASRENLMVVLSSLKEIKLRAIYFNRIHDSELISFEMDHAVARDELDSVLNQPALSVERCQCPPNHMGTQTISFN